MKVAIIYIKDIQGVINTFGIQNKEFYNRATIKRVTSSLERSVHNVTFIDGNKQIINRRITQKQRWSSSDISYISSEIPQVDGMGGICECPPSGNEQIVRHSIVERTLLLTLTLT